MNYYQILKIAPHASSDEIRKAFRREAKRCHPDLYHNKNPEEKQKLQKQFILLTKAYETLNDPSRRRSYDLQFQSNSAEQQRFRQQSRASKTTRTTYRRPSSEPFTETTDDSLENLLADVEELLGKFGLQFKDPLELLVDWALKVFQEFVTAWKEEDTEPTGEPRSFQDNNHSIMEEIEAELKKMKQSGTSARRETHSDNTDIKSSASREIEQELRELKKKYSR